MHTRLLYAACLLAAAALPSFADDVPFERLNGGVGAFNFPAGNYVAKSRAELDQQGLTQFVGQQSLDAIDWSTEMVLGVFMGAQSSGGYAISIERIERRQLLQIQPVPGPPPAFELAAQVMRISPGPGDLVTLAFTAPYQLVKVARSDDLITFEDLPTHLEFDRLTRSIGGFGFARSIEVEGDGSVTITTNQGGFGGPSRVDRGAIDVDRVGRLQAMLARAEFARIPADMGISGTQPVPADAPVTTYIRSFNGQTQRVSGFRPHADPAIDRRLDLIDRELEQVADEVLPSFDTLRLAITTVVPNDFLTVTVDVEPSGAVVVDQEYALKEIAFVPVHAQAPQALIDDLDMAVRLARIGQMPADLAPVGALHVQRSFRLTVGSLNNEYGGAVRGDMDTLPSAQAWKLERVFDAAAAIRDHALQGGSGGSEFKGIVRVQGGDVDLEGPHSLIRVNDADVARVLRNFAGRTVKLAGDLDPSQITDATILYPQPVQGQTALVHTDADGDATAWIGSNRVGTFGAAARAMALGDGNEVTFDGYLFLDSQQQPEELYVASVQATMTRFSWQTVRGVITGFLRRGDVVTLDRLSTTGRYARAADHETTGYVRVNRLRVGAPLPAIQPHPTPAPATGITGAIPGN